MSQIACKREGNNRGTVGMATRPERWNEMDFFSCNVFWDVPKKSLFLLTLQLNKRWYPCLLIKQIFQITLYVNGVKFRDVQHNPEIIDDWPLHPVKEVRKKLAVGACWRGELSYFYSTVMFRWALTIISCSYCDRAVIIGK